MPSWGEMLEDIQAEAAANNGQVNMDARRRGYIADLATLTGNSVVVYEADFLNKAGPQLQIQLGDVQGLMEVFRDLPGPNLDLVLHSPGGQAEATERLVRYMRSKFDHVRVFVPIAAMSAATMWAMAADEIVMGKHSQLGPIDPQITLPTGLTIPAGALLQQFREASDECTREPARVTAWLPTLQQYPPGLLNICENAAKLSETLVAEFLEKYMFSGEGNAKGRASEISGWLGDDKVHLSHSRPIMREELRDHGVNVTDLEDDPNLQDAVLSVHHAYSHTFQGPAVKIIENSLGRAYVIQGGVMMPPPTPTPGP